MFDAVSVSANRSGYTTQVDIHKLKYFKKLKNKR